MNKFFKKTMILFLGLFSLTLLLAFDEKPRRPHGSKRGVILAAASKLGVKNPLSLEMNFLRYNPNTNILTMLLDGDEVISGQQFKLNIRFNKKVYLYVFNIDSTNKLWTLFPKEELVYRNPLKPYVDYSIPADVERLMYEFDNKVGLERFYFFISDKRSEDFEKLLKQIPASGIILKKSSQLKKLLERAKPDLNSGISKVAIARINKQTTVKVRGRSYKINPLMILCKHQYAKKFVLFHKAAITDFLAPNLKGQANKEKWQKQNILTQQDIDDAE